MSPAADLIVPIQSRKRRRAALAQKFQHAVAGMVLLFQGLTTLQQYPEGAELAIALVEVATSAMLMVAMVRAIRDLRQRKPAAHGHAHSGIDWVDVLIALVLGVEVLERWHTSHHLSRPTILLALVLLTVGLLHGRIAAAGARRRALRVTSSGLSFPLRRPFARRTLAWPEIKAITFDAREAVIQPRNGKIRRIDLTDLDNAPEVIAALRDAQARLAAALPPAKPAPPVKPVLNANPVRLPPPAAD